MEFNPMFVVGVISFIFNFTLAVYVFVSNRQSAKDKDFQEVKGQVLTIAERVNNLPDHKAMLDIERDLSEVKTHIGNLNRSLDHMQRGITRIENHLLDKGK